MSEPQHRERTRLRLKRRVDAFFASKTGGRGEVADFAASLGDLGRAVVIGGMLRDLCLSGPRGFRSDVDFVVHPGSLAEYDRFIGRLGGKPNRFGGHSMELSHWKVEVWPLQRTWAAVKGHVAVDSVEDLLDVTFFDWDAILYDVAEKRLIASDAYYDRVSQLIIDMNLEPNPNPLGNAVRALRYAYRWNAHLGERLVRHICRQVSEVGWSDLVAYERSSFLDVRLNSVNGEAVTRCLRKYDRAGAGAVRLPAACPTQI
jgi:hypothetical protein